MAGAKQLLHRHKLHHVIAHVDLTLCRQYNMLVHAAFTSGFKHAVVTYFSQPMHMLNNSSCKLHLSHLISMTPGEPIVLAIHLKNVNLQYNGKLLL